MQPQSCMSFGGARRHHRAGRWSRGCLGADSIEPDGLAKALQLGNAPVLENKAFSKADFADRARYQDPSGIARGAEPRRQFDRRAEEITLFRHRLSATDADSEVQRVG